jgi:ABC-type lipoprotein release transport system permease subunit
LIGGLLYGVRIADPAALAVALGLLTGAAIFANTIPAARAPGIDPASALKQE